MILDRIGKHAATAQVQLTLAVEAWYSSNDREVDLSLHEAAALLQEAVKELPDAETRRNLELAAPMRSAELEFQGGHRSGSWPARGHVAATRRRAALHRPDRRPPRLPGRPGRQKPPVPHTGGDVARKAETPTGGECRGQDVEPSQPRGIVGRATSTMAGAWDAEDVA
jgi:hypothetical protein